MQDFIFGDITLETKVPPREHRLYEIATRYAELSSELEEIKTKISYYKEILAAEFPEEPGEYVIDIEAGQVVLKVPEKWEWDKAKLSLLYPTGATPDCVSTSYTVARVKYEAAAPEVKEVLKQALTIKCGLPTIKVNT